MRDCPIFPKLSAIFFLCLSASLFASCSRGGSSSDTQTSSDFSIARIWDEAILDAIRIDTPRPPVHARNLWHVSLAMYDAWAIYDVQARGYLVTEKLNTEDVAAARREAISYAAYRVLSNRYALSVNAATTLPALDSLMSELGYDISLTDSIGTQPSAVGNRVAEAVIALGNRDGSNQANNYADPTYKAVNSPLVVKFPGNEMSDPNAWQPLALDVAFSQNGIPLPSGVQPFIGSQWNGVLPFALQRASNSGAYVDTGEPPRLGTQSDLKFKGEVLDVLEHSALLSPVIDAFIDISPGAYGNNSLGTNDGRGRAENPATGQPYKSQTVRAGDFARVLAEFWADGPKSETPPGHWNTIANSVSDHALEKHQFEGQGESLDRLEWDVKLYFVLNAALHDAAINCWGLKRIYNSVRPISAIRYMATRGQSTDPSSPSYDPQGLPLVPGLTELISDATWPSGRHAGIKCCKSISGLPAPCVDSAGLPGIEISCLGEVAVFSWPGQPADKENEYGGVRWIRAKEWLPYQMGTFVTPAFPSYSSGHSTFSRAAAEVLTQFTGSAFFPGGLGEYTPSSLTFEAGPSEEVKLQWATFFDASDQAGQSRIYGGIHFQSDDFNGRIAGAQIGEAAFLKAKSYFAGNAAAAVGP